MPKREAAALSLFTGPVAAGLPDFDWWWLRRCDATTWLRSLPSASVDCCITDPAYSSLEAHRAKGTTTRLKKSDGSSNEWFPVVPDAYFGDFFAELYRVLRKNTHAYVFCDHKTMRAIVPMAEDAGFAFKKPIVWDKCAIGMGYSYRAKYEFILYFEKGKRNLASRSIPDILPVKRIHRGFPTEKPVPLIEILVHQSAPRDGVVIDPFLGSGSTGVAALTQGRRFMGVDIQQSAVEHAGARLDRVVNEATSDALKPPGIEPPASDPRNPWPPPGWKEVECTDEEDDEPTSSSQVAGGSSPELGATLPRLEGSNADGR